MRRMLLGNQRGQSIVQVLISIGLMGILMTAFATMMTNQSRETQALTEKLASLDFSRTVTQYLSNSTTCSAMFAASNLVNSGSMPFDATSISTAAPYVFALKQLPSGGAASPTAVAGSQVSLLSNSLNLLDSSASPTPGIQISVSSISPPTANLLLNFDQGRLVRNIHNLTFPIGITVSGPVNNTTITGCGNPTTAMAYVIDQKPSGTDAGNCVPGTWAKRDLNTVAYDTGVGVTVAGNQMTLPAGAYAVSISAPVLCTLFYKIRLRNITDGTTTAVGTTAITSNAYTYTSFSSINTNFTISAAKTFEIQHWGSTNYASGYCVGHAVNDGSPEIYTTVQIIKQ